MKPYCTRYEKAHSAYAFIAVCVSAREWMNAAYPHAAPLSRRRIWGVFRNPCADAHGYKCESATRTGFNF